MTTVDAGRWSAARFAALVGLCCRPCVGAQHYGEALYGLPVCCGEQCFGSWSFWIPPPSPRPQLAVRQRPSTKARRIFSAPPPHTHRCGAGGAKRSGQVPRARPAAPIRQKCAEKGLRAPTTRATYYIYVDTQRVYIHGSFGTLSPFIYSFIYIGFCDLPPSPFMYKPTGKGGGSLWSH